MRTVKAHFGTHKGQFYRRGSSQSTPAETDILVAAELLGPSTLGGIRPRGEASPPSSEQRFLWFPARTTMPPPRHSNDSLPCVRHLYPFPPTTVPLTHPGQRSLFPLRILKPLPRTPILPSFSPTPIHPTPVSPNPSTPQRLEGTLRRKSRLGVLSWVVLRSRRSRHWWKREIV